MCERGRLLLLPRPVVRGSRQGVRLGSSRLRGLRSRDRVAVV